MGITKACILLLTICIYSFSGTGSQEFPITTEPHNQYYPAVHGDYVVWQDDRNGNYDIYGYNLKTHEEFPITTDPATQELPAIYNDIVIWKDNRHNTYTVYGYNLQTQKEFYIAKSPGSRPALYEKTVITIDMGGDNPAIHGYNLSTEEEFHISLDPGNVNLYPAIYNNIIVWKSTGKHGDKIYAYDITTQQKFNIPPSRFLFPIHRQDYPAIHNNTIVWTEDFYNFIYGYNLSTDEEFFITTHKSYQQSPAIYQDLVVWQDYRNNNWDIYGSYITPYTETSKSKTGTVLFRSLLSIVIVALIGINTLLITWNIWYMTSVSTPAEGFKKSSTYSHVYFALALLFALSGIYYIIDTEPLFASFWFIMSTFWFTTSLLNRKYPYVCITDDEIFIFPPMAFRKKIVKLSDIKDINVEDSTIRLLSNGEYSIINLLHMNEQDRENLIKTLKQVRNSIDDHRE